MMRESVQVHRFAVQRSQAVTSGPIISRLVAYSKQDEKSSHLCSMNEANRGGERYMNCVTVKGVE